MVESKLFWGINFPFEDTKINITPGGQIGAAMRKAHILIVSYLRYGFHVYQFPTVFPQPI